MGAWTMKSFSMRTCPSAFGSGSNGWHSPKKSHPQPGEPRWVDEEAGDHRDREEERVLRVEHGQTADVDDEQQDARQDAEVAEALREPAAGHDEPRDQEQSEATEGERRQAAGIGWVGREVRDGSGRVLR